LCSNATASFVYLEFQILKTHERVTMKVIYCDAEWAMYSACRIRMQLQHWMGDATWKTNCSNAIMSAQQLQWSKFKVEPNP